MDIEAFLKKNPIVTKWMKWGGITVVVIWIVREIFMMTMFHSLFGFVTNGIDSQEAAIKSMQEQAEVHMQNVENGMRGVMSGIHEGEKEIDKKLEKLSNDFKKADKVESELKHAHEDFKKSSDETTKRMFAEIDRQSKEYKKQSDKIWKQWESDHEKSAKAH